MKWLLRKIRNLFKKKKPQTKPTPEPVQDTQEPVQQELPLDIAPLINEEGLELIKEFEGFYPNPYLCPANVPTIGYGTIKYPNGKKVTLQDQNIDEETAKEYLRYEVNEKAESVHSYLKSINFKATPNEFSALVSFAYNLGTGPIKRSNSTVNRGLKANDRDLVCKGMMLYVKAKVGWRMKTLPGLVRRRKAEVALFKKEM